MAPTPLSPLPFFIGGAGRSGSTFLYYLLRDHPQVALTNEARVIDALGLAIEAASLPYGQRAESGLLGLCAPDFVPLLQAKLTEVLPTLHLAVYRERFGNQFTHFGDKLPGPEALAVAAAAFPETRVVLLLRDPRDVVCSYRALQRADYDKGPLGAAMDAASLEDFANTWVRTYQVFLKAKTPALFLPYEVLISDPEAAVRAVLEHLGLPFVAEVAQALRDNDTIGGHGTSRTSGESLRRFEKDLTRAEAAEVLRRCGPTWDAMREAYAAQTVAPAR